MSRQLDWREAERRDYQTIRDFRCSVDSPRTADGRLLAHPAPWAREVEVGLRCEVIPPVDDGSMLLGFAGNGDLVAVVLLFDGAREGDSFNMKLAAVAVERRYQKQGLGAEATLVAVQAAADRGFGFGCRSVTVVGQVDPRNRDSQGTCASAGFSRQGDQGDYQEWGLTVELPEDF